MGVGLTVTAAVHVLVRPVGVVLALAAVVLAGLVLISCGSGFDGTWVGVDGAAKGSGLKVVRVDDYWRASQLDAAVLPWDANVFRERDGRLVSFGDSRPSFTATISRDGDTLTVRTPDGVYHYTRD
jgi:hypothetical protein